MTKQRSTSDHRDAPNRLADSGPIRTCAGCGRAQSIQSNAANLARVASQDGAEPVFAIELKSQRREFGRGAWICRNGRCVELAWKKRGFERILKLKTRAPETLKSALLQWCNGEKTEQGAS